MDDLISRKALLEKIRIKKEYWLPYSELTSEGLREAEEIICDAPAVEPVTHGRWEMAVIPVCGEYNFQCSVCKESFWRGYSYPDIAHYCPNFGAKMDGDGNG